VSVSLRTPAMSVASRDPEFSPVDSCPEHTTDAPQAHHKGTSGTPSGHHRHAKQHTNAGAAQAARSMTSSTCRTG